MTPEEYKQRVRDYQKTFLSESGQNVLADLSKQCWENSKTFVVDSTHLTAYREGMRAIMLYIRHVVATNPESALPTKAITHAEEREPTNG